MVLASLFTVLLPLSAAQPQVPMQTYVYKTGGAHGFDRETADPLAADAFNKVIAFLKRFVKAS